MRRQLDIVQRQLHARVRGLLAHLRVDGAGVHVVHAHVRVLGRDALEEARFRDHAGAVGGEAGRGREEADAGGGEGDEDRLVLVRAALGAQGRQEGARRDVAAADVGLEGLPVLLRVGVGVADGRQRGEVSGVVDEDVDAALVGRGGLQLGEGAVHGGRVEDVSGEGEDFRLGILRCDGRGDGLQGGGRAPGDPDGGGAGSGEGVRDAVPDSSAAACDHDGLTGDREMRLGWVDRWVDCVVPFGGQRREGRLHC